MKKILDVTISTWHEVLLSKILLNRVIKAFLPMAFVSFLAVGCSSGGSITGAFSETVDPWVAANDAFVIRDCVAVLENLSRAELNPNLTEESFSRAAFMRGVCAEQQGDISDAVGAYKYVLTKHPNTPSAYLSGERLRKLSNTALVQ